MDSKEILSATPHYVGLCDQKNGRILICDLAEPDWTKDNGVVWEYKHDIRGHENYGWAAGLKFRHSDYYGGDVMLFCGPPSMGYIVSMETKEVLLAAKNAGFNPHSVELLPDGTFIVCSSNDGLVNVYAPGETEPYYTLQLAGDDNGHTDVHGVLWDPEYETLWISGGKKLRAFRVEVASKKSPLVLRAEYDSPSAGLHDLVPVYGDPHALLLSPGGGITKFDKRSGEFSFDYSCGDLGKTQGYVPGCGLFADGVLTYTTPIEGIYYYWNTDEVQIGLPAENGETVHLTRKAPGDAYYKMRIFNTDYQ